MSSPFDAESESDPDAVATGRFSAAAPWGLDEQLADLEQDISGGLHHAATPLACELTGKFESWRAHPYDAVPAA